MLLTCIQAGHNQDMRALTSSPHLLNLPLNIRARIYVAALINTEPEGDGEGEYPVWIYSGRNDPIATVHLFRVCRQIQDEALPIYYLANDFLPCVYDLQVTSFIPWWAKIEPYRQQTFATPIVTAAIAAHLQGKVNVEFGYEKADWQGLLEWLRLFHEKLFFPFRKKDIAFSWGMSERAFMIFVAAFQMVEDLADENLPWSVVRKMLGGIRTLLIEDDEQWGHEAEEKGDDGDTSSSTMDNDDRSSDGNKDSEGGDTASAIGGFTHLPFQAEPTGKQPDQNETGKAQAPTCGTQAEKRKLSKRLDAVWDPSNESTPYDELSGVSTPRQDLELNEEQAIAANQQLHDNRITSTKKAEAAEARAAAMRSDDTDANLDSRMFAYDEIDKRSPRVMYCNDLREITSDCWYNGEEYTDDDRRELLQSRYRREAQAAQDLARGIAMDEDDRHSSGISPVTELPPSGRPTPAPTVATEGFTHEYIDQNGRYHRISLPPDTAPITTTEIDYRRASAATLNSDTISLDHDPNDSSDDESLLPESRFLNQASQTPQEGHATISKSCSKSAMLMPPTPGRVKVATITPVCVDKFPRMPAMAGPMKSMNALRSPRERERSRDIAVRLEAERGLKRASEEDKDRAAV